PENISNLWVAFGGLGLGILLFFYHWIGWYFSVYIVTNQRLRQITQKGFFNRSVIDLGISKIQNISYNVPGITATALGFGTIVVQTYVGDLLLNKIHHPSKIYNMLSEVVTKYGGETLADE
ncbi:MAG TPA: PH domain-containing protein, partial [Candidatus Saccharimonadales bacterium]|nr:PH domain-containing protein [Candidatus Saccharimonadales bacterium]